MPQTNITYFSGSATQEITGETNFYRFVKNTANTVNINNDINVAEEFHLLSGTLDDNSNEISVYGHLFNHGIHVYGGSGNGVYIIGSAQQEMTSSGEWGKITLNNPNGVIVETTAEEIEVNNAVRLVSGVFDIGKNLLIMNQNAMFEEGNTYSGTNMIQSNISFTDNGIKKHFLETFSGNFTYPIGSMSKYTPVSMDISSTGVGSMRVRAANEMHPTIVEDEEECASNLVDQSNALKYYWTLEAKDGLSNFNADVHMKFYTSDAIYQAPYALDDYITAKLILGTTFWNKYDYDSFDETNEILEFEFTNADASSINGDYTAGVEVTCGGAIPDDIPAYISVANGDWEINTNWATYDLVTHITGLPGVNVPTNGPRGAIAIVDSPHRIEMLSNYIINYKTTVNGILDVGNSYGQRLGIVDGVGEIYLERGDIPAAVYDDFILPNTGTFHFGGTTDYDIMSQLPIINNLKLSGTGKRRFPNMDVVLRGTWVIDGTDNTLQVINEHNRKVEVRNNITFNSGTFDAGTGAGSIVEIGGTTAQSINGTGSFTGANAFNHFEMSNPSGLHLNRPVDIEQTLTFYSGVIYTSTANILTLKNTAQTGVVLNAGDGKFVDGPLNKDMLSGNYFDFPVGDAGRYGNIHLSAVTSNGIFQTEYFNYNPNNHVPAMNPANYLAPIALVSENEFWRVAADASQDAYVKLRWDAFSGVSSDATERQSIRVAEWDATDSRWEASHSNITASGTETAGSVTTATTLIDLTGSSYFTLSSTLVRDNVWQGDISNDWHTAGNWSLNVVPTSFSNTEIPTDPISNPNVFPIISSSAKTRELEIQTGATVTINAGADLTASSTFTNNGTMYIKSPAGEGPSGSFIDNGAMVGTGTVHVERYLSPNKYHYVSSPITGGNAGSNLFTSHSGGYFNPNFYKYNEAHDLDGNPATAPAGAFNSDNLVSGWQYAHAGSSGGDVAMIVKKGYAFWNDEVKTVDFIGVPNSGDMSVTGLTLNQNDVIVSALPNYYDGWNLVGNPYPSAINWDLVRGSLNNVDDGIYVWDGNQYASYASGVKGGSMNLSNMIAPMQAFYVHATADNAGFTLNNSHRAHSSENYLKSGEKEQMPDFIRLKMNANGFNDFAVIYFKQNASSGFDGSYDAFKLYSSNSSVPHIYSVTENDQTPLSINVLPKNYIEENHIVPITVKIGKAGTYTISLEDFNFENTHVYFVDKIENQEIYLNEESLQNYSFSCGTGTLSNRFELRFFNNNAPIVIEMIANKEFNEDEAFSFTLPENAFVENDFNDEITSYTLTLSTGENLPEWVKFNTETKEIYGTARNENVGTMLLEYSAFDKMNAKGSQIFELKINNTNDAPFVNANLNNVETFENEIFEYALPENLFIDEDFGDILTYAISLASGESLPDWLNFDAETMTFSGTPENDNVGSLEISIRASDTQNAWTQTTFVLTIINVNDAPTVINQIADQSVNQFDKFYFEVPTDIFDDIDEGDKLSLSATLSGGASLPDWLGFENGIFTGNASEYGLLSITVRATDLFGAYAEDEFELRINQVSSREDISARIAVYPNPAQGTVYIANIDEAKYNRLIVTDIYGKTIIERNLTKKREEIDLTGFAKGIYFIELSGNKDTFGTKLFVK